MKHRVTKQRTVILECVQNHEIHPTAEQVHNMLYSDYPELSLATVYRNLKVLTNMHALIKISMPGGAPDRFDGNLSPHLHFLCENCEQLIDIHVDRENQLEKQIETTYAHQIKSTEILFQGICSQCG